MERGPEAGANRTGPVLGPAALRPDDYTPDDYAARAANYAGAGEPSDGAMSPMSGVSCSVSAIFV